MVNIRGKIVNKIKVRVKEIENKFNIIKRYFLNEKWNLSTLKKMYRIHNK